MPMNVAVLYDHCIQVRVDLGRRGLSKYEKKCEILSIYKPESPYYRMKLEVVSIIR